MLDYNIKPFVFTDMFKISTIYTMFNSSYNPGDSFIGESHDFWEFTYIKEGSLFNCVDDKVYEIKKGDLIFYKPMEFHHHYVEDENGVNTFFIAFSFENCPPDFAADTVYKLNPHQKEIIEKLIDFVNNAEKTSTFTEEEIAIQKENYINYDYVKPLLALNKKPLSKAIVLNYIYELFLSLCDSKNIVEETDSYHAGIYRDAIAFMTEHISEKITVSDIANHCHISETSLKKIFYQFTNTSIHKYFTRLKITQAIILLKSGVSSIEVTRRIGFADQAYFSVAFKRETGFTPREYLKKGE